MRLAISGTHCSGKSSLVDAFLAAHPDYTQEPEPYEVLHELYGETFAAEPSAQEFFRQLEYNVTQLQQYGAGDQVVFERSPFDYVVYLQALVDLSRDTADPVLVKQSIEVATGAVNLLDMIVYLPAGGANIYIPEEEDVELRSAVD